MKLSLQFKGREMEFKQLGREMFEVGGVLGGSSKSSLAREDTLGLKDFSLLWSTPPSLRVQ